MLTVLRVMCEKNLRKRITLPAEWLKRTATYFVFTYFIENHIRSIQIDLDEDGAEFLKEMGMIDSYKGSGKNVEMFCTNTIYVTGKKGEPVEWKRSIRVGWNDIKFYRDDVVHLAARYEYNLTGSSMGIAENRAKVRSITKAA